MGTFVGLSALSWYSRGTSLVMETKPMRDEMKPEGHARDQEMHDMMGMPLTSWHGHRRTSFTMAAKAPCEAPGTWRAYESRTHEMKATRLASCASA